MSGVTCQVSGVRCHLSGVRCHLSITICQRKQKPEPQTLPLVRCHASLVMCQVSCVRCHVSGVTCQMSRVTCQVSGVTFFLSGGVSLLRVCYQWGLPRLVFIISRDFKIYPVQCSTVQNTGRSAVPYIAVHCKSAVCYTVKINAVQEIELLSNETIYIFKTFQ